MNLPSCEKCHIEIFGDPNARFCDSCEKDNEIDRLTKENTRLKEDACRFYNADGSSVILSKEETLAKRVEAAGQISTLIAENEQLKADIKCGMNAVKCTGEDHCLCVFCRLDHFETENEQLKKDYDEACDDAMTAAREGRERAEKAEAEVKRLREALNMIIVYDDNYKTGIADDVLAFAKEALNK